MSDDKTGALAVDASDLVVAATVAADDVESLRGESEVVLSGFNFCA